MWMAKNCLLNNLVAEHTPQVWNIRNRFQFIPVKHEMRFRYGVFNTILILKFSFCSLYTIYETSRNNKRGLKNFN